MNLYRLSLEARPGPRAARDDFGDVAERLGPFGVEVLDFSNTSHDRASADEVLIDLTRPIDLPLIEHVLKPTGRKLLALKPLHPTA